MYLRRCHIPHPNTLLKVTASQQLVMDDLELEPIHTREVGLDSTPTEENLPRVDGGKDAWLVLASVFVQGALVWGNAS